MAENQTKTLKDYLLEGGARDRFFHQTNPSCRSGIYQLQSIYVAQESNQIVIISKPLGSSSVRRDDYLNNHLEDTEATPEEVQRAKEEESRLVQKLSS